MRLSCDRKCCRLTLALVILVGLGGRANADTIVQIVNYDFEISNTTFGYYSQFDPSLGTLDDVMIQCSGNSNPLRCLFQESHGSASDFHWHYELQAEC